MKIPFAVNDLGLRLSNGILRYKGHPYIVSVDDHHNISLHNTVTRRQELTVSHDDPDIDISCIPLGYVQLTPRHVDYLSRIPRQTARQLVTRESVQRQPVFMEMDERIPDFWHSQGFQDSILGIFPSVDEAFERINAEERRSIAVAISRDTCLVKKEGRDVVEVFIREKYSGWIAPNSREISVKGDFMSHSVQKTLSKHGLNYRAA